MSWKVSPQYKDPDYSNVSLLLHGNGTNGSTTITDSSPTPKTVTAVGNAQISTAIADPFGNSTGVLAFDGTGDYLQTPHNNDFNFGAGDFTIELWSKSSQTGAGAYVGHRTAGGAGNTNWLVQTGFPTPGKVGFYASDGSSYQVNGIATTTSVNDGQWHHIAVSRAGSTFRLFCDGVSEATATWAGAIASTSRVVQIGNDNADAFFNGYIDDLRITKGVARYTSNFSVPPAQFPDI